MISEPNDTKSHSKLDAMLSLANNAVRESVRSPLDVGSPNTFGNRLSRIKSKSKKIDQQSPKRSKSSEGLRKVMARLSFQPSKRKLPHLQRADPVTISDNRQSLHSKSKKIDQQSSKHSKSSEGFRKVMARLSFQPSKRKLPHLQRADPVTISDNRQSLHSKQSEFRASRTRHSFLV
jgi:DNA-directed RNA polymerase subunit H (RpoH/RPB5)